MKSDATIRPEGLSVPSGRLSRLARFGGVAGSLAGGVALGAAREAVAGRRPRLADLLLTPANAARFARELSHLRGAAMKMGQLLSMDAGEMLPPEIAEAFAHLRADAQHMPPKQLRAALDRRWGRGWLDRFERFDPRPMAAASIGQVHRATTKDGRDLAIKIQYPGVRESIDSDVANMATLIRMAGALPDGLDMGPLLAEARRQLRDEADYAREGAYLDRYRTLLAEEPDFVVPRRHADFTSQDVLAMDFVSGAPVEAAATAPQAERDRIAERLIDLALRELLDFRLMQTDPNFANYRWDREAGRIVLLDFGAAREIPVDVAEGYRAMIRASLDGDVASIREGLIAMGLLDRAAATKRAGELDAMIRLGVETLAAGGPYDFGADPVSRRLRDDGIALATDRDFWRAPPADPLFVQRKLAGMHLLANRLRARVDVRALLERRLG